METDSIIIINLVIRIAGFQHHKMRQHNAKREMFVCIPLVALYCQAVTQDSPSAVSYAVKWARRGGLGARRPGDYHP